MPQSNGFGDMIKERIPNMVKNMFMGESRQPNELLNEDTNNTFIDKKAISNAIQTLKDYKAGKTNLESRIVEEERWWKLRHWDVIRNKTNSGSEARPEPTSAWLFNSIANKHADIMDNYPEPNVLPRELSDENDAKMLSSILPVVFERNEYENTYSRCAWYKLKHGVVAKGVFWNNALERGLGDIDIRFIDILNLFWEPGITDIQDSRNIFNVDLVDNDVLESQYPHLKGKLKGQIIDVKQYIYDDTVDVGNKSLIVDWYYKKKTPEGKDVLHLCKFAGDVLLFASENKPDKYPNGFYEHGRYPFEFDVLFPEEGTPVGFGYISVMKSPQLYIDKLSQVILENAVMSAKPRFMVKKNAAINENEFLDWSKPLVYYDGDPNNIIEMKVQQVGGNILNVLQMKIDELKETSSNRDVSQGSSSGGVTAAAAIAALQEAGNKTSRDMISSAYRSYTQECYLAIELIRQFYDEERTFRILGEEGGYQYVSYSNQGIRGEQIPPAYNGEEISMGYSPAMRVPVFDVVIKPQKRSPYSKMAQNELAKELYQLGFFNPQLAEQSLTALDLMDFDGEEKVRRKVQDGQTMLNQMMAMRDQMNKMGAIIYRLTGDDVLGIGSDDEPQAQPRGGSDMKRGMGSANTNAMKETMTSYGEALAKRARPDMEGV